MEKEIRNIALRIGRPDLEKRTVEGVALVFNSDSNDIGFIEQIAPEAIDEDTIARSDVFCYLNHDESRGVLARCKNGKGSLDLWLETDGLHYRFEAPKTQLGDELLSYLDRGEITCSSFAFIVAVDGDIWSRDAENKLHRRIIKIDRLFDVSPVFQPAYSATSSTRRKVDELQNLQEKINAIQKEIDAL